MYGHLISQLSWNCFIQFLNLYLLIILISKIHNQKFWDQFNDFFDSKWPTSEKVYPFGYTLNDICLVYLETRLDFGGNEVKYIKAAIDDPEPGTMCDISGWGELEVST